MVAITRERLRAFAPVAKPEIIEAILAGADELDKARINTPLRLQHFMAQIAVESGGLRQLEENLSYTAERLHAVWPARFKTVAAARPYARNPEKLANKVYGGRLGNTQAGDGWRFRGSGLMQTTGRTNFKAAGHEDDPEFLRTPAGALTAAIKFWTDHGLNLIADRDDVTAVRKRVNGGANGLAEARNYLAKAKKVFTADEADDDHPEELKPARVKALQEQLVKLGYVQLGKPDGHVGAMTVGAISAFQAENGLTVTGRFDEETQGHLYEAEPRSVTRASEEPEDSRIVGASRTMKKGALGLIGVSAADLAADPLTAIEGVKSKMAMVEGVLAPFKAGSAFLAQHWMIAVVAVAVAVWLYSHRIEQARLDDHASGASA